jgi:hypothetical protein
MIRNPTKKCNDDDCKDIAQYGVREPTHCETHKAIEEINLIERKCIECGRLDVLYQDGKCVNFCHLEDQNNIYRRQIKQKETRVLDILTKVYGSPQEYNSRVSSECGGRNREEKEIVYDCKTHQVHVEVDEKMHSGYCVQGEKNRMINLYMSEGGVPLVFLRYNPDSFTDLNCVRSKIPRSKREEDLVKWVGYFMDRCPKKQVGVKYLFYDTYSDGSDMYYEIDPYGWASKKLYSCPCGKEFLFADLLKRHRVICK